MKKIAAVLMTAGCILGFGGMAMAAGASAEQTATYKVDPINELAVTGTPILTINAAVAGQEPAPVTDNSTTYAITTNCATDGKKITAAINSDMPDGTTLVVNLAAPTGATSVSDQSLSSTAVDVVTGLDGVAESGKMISYTLSATAAAGVVSSTDKTVTFTIADNS